MQDAFFLLLRNCARLAVLTGVVSFLMFLSKIVVVGLCAALSYIVFSGTLQVSQKLNIALILQKLQVGFIKRPFLSCSILYALTGCTAKCVGC